MKCNIIGGGNSLRDYDLTKIKGTNFVLNHVYKYMDYDYLCHIDSPKHFEGATNTETIKIHGGKWETKGSRIQFEDNKVINIQYSVFFTLNVAIHLGFTEFHFYGCDNHCTNSEYAHFYDTTPVTDERRLYDSNAFQIIDRVWAYIKPDLEDCDLYFYNSDIKHFNNREL